MSFVCVAAVVCIYAYKQKISELRYANFVPFLIGLRQLKNGRFGSIRELAEYEKHDSSYISKILSLTLLAPDIVETILDRRQPDVLTWEELRKPFPMLWSEQQAKWGMQEPV